MIRTAIAVSAATLSAACDAGTGRLLEVDRVALIGEVAPGTDGQFVIGSLRDSYMNNLGEVGFRASDVRFNDGFWMGRPGAAQLVARDGDPSPLAAYTWGGFINFAVNKVGDVAFISGIDGPGIDPSNNGILWVGRPGALKAVVQKGDPAPGAAAGVTFRNFEGRYSTLNSLGQVALFAEMQGPGPDLAVPRWGIWVASAQSVDPLILHSRLDGPEGLIRINNKGMVGFTMGSALFSPTSVWVGEPGNLTMIAREGDTVPGTNGLIHRLLRSHPCLNDAGQVVFSNEITGLGVNQFNDDAVWVGNTPALTIAAREGDVLAQIGPGVHFNDLERSNPLLTSTGDIAFVTTVEGVGIDSTNDNALFIGTSNGLRIVAREGDPVPGAPDWHFFRWTFGDAVPVANSAGQLIFNAPVTNGTEFGNGVFAFDSRDELHTIAMPGDLIEVATGDVRVIESAGFSGPNGIAIGGEDGLSSPLNDLGQLVFGADFRDGSEGIFVAAIPVPCPGDFDLDDDVDISDLHSYLDLWFSRDPAAEMTGDEPPLVNAFDLQTFLRNWSLGCPPRRSSHPAVGPQRDARVVNERLER